MISSGSWPPSGIGILTASSGTGPWARSSANGPSIMLSMSRPGPEAVRRHGPELAAALVRPPGICAGWEDCVEVYKVSQLEAKVSMIIGLRNRKTLGQVWNDK